jgi:hypothetical protein
MSAVRARAIRERAVVAVVATCLALAGSPARAGVFDGDPIDPDTGEPRVLLPGVALIHPGPDEKYDGDEDVFDASFAGDVDLVLRSGGVNVGAGFPPPAAGVASAPAVVAGGTSLGGTEVAFDVVASDGAASPPGGHPLLDPELDGRGALVFAYADLDGDGFIGPTNADGASDLEVERQEVLTPVGRQVAVFLAGIASGGLGVSLAAPASSGGLALVLVAGATTGAVPPLYEDGPWIATMLPFMPSTDPRRILGGNSRSPDPDYLADVELEMDSNRHWVPTPGHPVIGTPLAIPLDGSSATVDLARAEAGTAVSAALGVAIDPATFVAVPGKRLLPARDPTGTARVLVDATTPLVLPDDGPGHAATVLVFAADLLGNPADPAAPLDVALEVGPSLRIASPDGDGDPARETIALASAASAAITLDDVGVANDSPALDRLIAVVGGAPTAALDVQVGGGVPLPGWSSTRAVLRLGADPARAMLRGSGAFDAGASVVDPAMSGATITLRQGAEVLYARSFPAASFAVNLAANRFTFRDPISTATGRVRSLVVERRRREPTVYELRWTVRPLDLSAAGPQRGPLTWSLQVGTVAVSGTLPCIANPTGTVMRCLSP